MSVKLSQSFFDTKLVLFDLGLAASGYYILQYLAAPLVYWATLGISGEFTNLVFGGYEALGMDFVTPQVYVYMVYGFAAFVAGYFAFSGRSLGQRIPEAFCRRWSIPSALLVSGSLIAMGFLWKAVKLLSEDQNSADYFGNPDLEYVAYANLFGSGTVGYMLSFNWFHLIGMAVALIAGFESEKRRGTKLAFYLGHGIFLLLFTVSLGSGGHMLTFSIALEYLIIRQFYRPMRWRRSLLIVSILAIAVFAMKNAAREVNWNTAVVEGEAARSLALNLAVENFGEYMARSVARVSMAPFVTVIVQTTDELYYGETFQEFFEELKPPGIRKNEVRGIQGNEFGRLIGILDASDQVTGIASSIVGDLYRNFGLLGIITGMYLLGFLYRTIYKFCVGTEGPLGVLTYSFVWPILIHGLESPVGSLLATVVKALALSMFVHFVVRVGTPDPRPAPQA